ncbi:MAG: VapE family protein [Dysgonamonadaceae bacterium]|nr:VapE family protein [Dysgonamonadaceae bacterium]
MKKKTDSSVRQSKNERIEAHLQEKYNFRFNVIKSKPEYHTKNSNYSFQPVTKFALNSFKRRIDTELGISTSAENIRTILESDFSPKVHPVKDYFWQLPRLKPEINQYILQLAHTVTTANPEKWNEYLTKWLMGVGANALEDTGCQNHTCLVLTGEQGRFKTTWLDHLCPQSLKSYLFTGKIDPQNKDVLTMIAEYLFINIDDQLKALNKRDENELKNLITTPAVKYRRPYDVYIEEYPHLASFMASVNGNDFLTDPTGSRRFLPFEVISIDIKTAEQINMDNVFSEVMWLLDNGYRYWFVEEEIAELHRLSQQFHVQTVEYEMLLKGFEKPEADEECYMTTSEVLSYLQAYTLVKLSEKRMGEALRKADFERLSKRLTKGANPVQCYRIKKIKPNPFLDRDI